MFNLIIHSNPYKKTNQIIDPRLYISAKNKYQFYTPYICQTKDKDREQEIQQTNHQDL